MYFCDRAFSKRFRLNIKGKRDILKKALHIIIHRMQNDQTRNWFISVFKRNNSTQCYQCKIIGSKQFLWFRWAVFEPLPGKHFKGLPCPGKAYRCPKDKISDGKWWSPPLVGLRYIHASSLKVNAHKPEVHWHGHMSGWASWLGLVEPIPGTFGEVGTTIRSTWPSFGS